MCLFIGTSRLESGKQWDKIMKNNETETKWVIFVQWSEVHLTFLCIKNYTKVYKGMSALSVADKNLEAVSQRE